MDKSNKEIYMKIYKNSKRACHRLNGTAREYSNGDKFWYKEKQLHKADGPACEYASGYKE